MNGRDHTGRGRRALVALVFLILVSCTGGHSSHEAFHPTLEWGRCPADIEIQYLSRHQCGWLTVLQDRSQPKGKTIRLLAVKTWPVGISPPPGIGSGFGHNLGDPYTYGDTAAGATRMGHIGIELEQRGTGHSEPSLVCPEVEALSGRAASSLTGDASLANDLLAAVKACRDRLTKQGVDPADYDVRAVAGDLEDLRLALGIRQWWTLSSYGTGSRYLFEYLRDFPGHARAAYLDSPQFPQIDEVTGGASGIRYALGQLLETCRTDPECVKNFPNLERSCSEAIARLSRHPLHGATGATPGGRVEVTVDSGTFLRAVRFALGGDGPAGLSGLPALIVAASEGRMTRDLARYAATDQPFCAGYRPLCTAQQGFSLGAYLSVLCSDEAPVLDAQILESAARNDPAFESVFLRDPFLAACAPWHVPAADPDVRQSVHTDVPLLILSGQFDSFSPLPAATEAAQTLDHAYVLQIPGATHNALGFSDCPIEIRNE